MQFVLLCDTSREVKAHCAGRCVGQTTLACFLFIEVNAGLPGKAEGRDFICSSDKNQKIFKSQLCHFVCQQRSKLNLTFTFMSKIKPLSLQDVKHANLTDDNISMLCQSTNH